MKTFTMTMLTLFQVLILVMFSACTWTVQDTRTPEQRSADQTRVAEAVPPLGHVKVSLLPQGTLVPTVTPEPTEIPCADIKGNISQSGEKIYHVKGQANYENTLIDKEGESWFCSEEEAQAAGFRKALR